MNKASGPDGIPAVDLKKCAPESSPVLTRLYCISLKTSVVPKSWKLANIQPVTKKGSRADPANYRLIASTSIICNIMEHVLNTRILVYLKNDFLSDPDFAEAGQLGNLLLYATHVWCEVIEKHGEVLTVSLDISKAFDKVWHASLIGQLPSYRPLVSLCNWVSDLLREWSIRVVIDSCSSDLMAIDAGVPQGSVLSVTLFLLHINDLLTPGIVEYTDVSTVVDRYLSGARTTSADTQSLRGILVERMDLSLQAVSEWGDYNLVGFNATKTKACLFPA